MLAHKYVDFEEAFFCTNLRKFLNIVFPDEWSPIAARKIESGAEFSLNDDHFAPKWTHIPLTVRKGKTDLETCMKSVIFRVHDCIHHCGDFRFH